MNISLSNKDILKALNNKTKVIEYKELKKYNNVLELINPYDSVVILYSTGDGYGHWTCLIKDKKRIEFFDSYGYKPDNEFSFINKNFRDENGMNQLHLRKLLNNAYDNGFSIHYNDKRLQSSNESVNTCGRWCIMRIYLKKMNSDEFAKKIKNDKNVLELTSNIPEN